MHDEPRKKKKKKLLLKSAINQEIHYEIRTKVSLKTPAKVSSKLTLSRMIAKHFNLFCPFNDTSCVSFSFQAKISCGDFLWLVPTPCPLGKSDSPQISCALFILQAEDRRQQIQDLFNGSARYEDSPAEQQCL